MLPKIPELKLSFICWSKLVPSPELTPKSELSTGLKTFIAAIKKIIIKITTKIHANQGFVITSSFPKEPELETAEEQLQETKEKPRQKTSKRDGFENYLR